MKFDAVTGQQMHHFARSTRKALAAKRVVLIVEGFNELVGKDGHMVISSGKETETTEEAQELAEIVACMVQALGTVMSSVGAEIMIQLPGQEAPRPIKLTETSVIGLGDLLRQGMEK